MWRSENRIHELLGRTLLAAGTAWFTLSAFSAQPAGSDRLLQILRQDPRFAEFLADPLRYRLQIVLGLIEEDEAGGERLVQLAYRAGEEYFYPASSIKMCAAVAALEELAEIRASTGLGLNEATPLVYHALFEGEELEDSDPSNADGGSITVAHEIRKLFLVSDNVAFNRLYELVGPAGLNRSMHRAGLGSARLVHRLAERRTPEENRTCPRIEFRGEAFRYELPRRVDSLELEDPPIAGLEIGRGYVAGGELVAEPMDFRKKNRMSLVDLQRALAMIVRPGLEAAGRRFRLSEGDRSLLMQAMSELPRESRNPAYDRQAYPDPYVKFFLPGLRRVLPEKRIRIYNKIGQAYGFTTENAWIVDTGSARSFFLAATIYTNRNGILNDDQYEYRTVAEPFLADLGEAVARTLWGPAETSAGP